MPKVPIDDSYLQVVKSLRPFLGDRGNGFVSTLESLEELLSSEQAQKTLRSFRVFGFEEKFQSLEVTAEAAPNAFTLFLILILLILADIPGLANPNASAIDKESEITVEFV